MDRRDIEEVLPHRDAMLIPDRIIEVSALEFAVGVKTITSDEPCFCPVGRADDRPTDYPVSLMVEFLGQVAAVLCIVSFSELGPRSNLLPIFASASGVKLGRLPRVGETLIGTAWISRRLDTVVAVTGQVSVDGDIIMDAERALIAFKQSARPAVLSGGTPSLGSEAPRERKAR